jgi:hypothetical protein
MTSSRAVIEAAIITAMFGGIAAIIRAAGVAIPPVSQSVIALSQEVRRWFSWLDRRRGKRWK